MSLPINLPLDASACLFDDDRAAAIEFLSGQGVNFPSFLKKGSDMAFIDGLDRRWSGAVPATCLYDSVGRLQRSWEGKTDYSTLERRRTLCEDEVRLNRRFAPTLYLGVAAISGTHEGPVVDGVGQPIEYAVRMRQFRLEDELPALLATGGAGPDDLAVLGTVVARFHAGAACVTADSPYGRSHWTRPSGRACQKRVGTAWSRLRAAAASRARAVAGRGINSHRTAEQFPNHATESERGRWHDD